MTRITWVGLEADSTERCHVLETSEGVEVSSTVELPDGVLTYALRADADWRFASLTVRHGERRLDVVRAAGRWWVDDQERPDLGEALEVDIAVSPLSNTLPIRRLHLQVGDSADIVTAYITVPDLAVTTDPQRYTRLAEHRYRYDSRDSDFTAVLDVDAQGLVTRYPGLFQSVAS